MNIVHKYRWGSINTVALYAGYREFRDEQNFDEIAIQICPIYNRLFLRYKGSKFTDAEFEDLFQDVLLKVYYFIKNNEIRHPGKLYNAINTTIRNAIVDKLNTYHPRIVYETVEDIRDLKVDYGSYKKVYESFHFEDLIKILVDEFKYRLRFEGDARKLCYEIFQSLLTEQDLKLNVLKYRYKLNVKYYLQYTRILIRSIVRQLALERFDEFELDI